MATIADQASDRHLGRIERSLAHPGDGRPQDHRRPLHGDGLPVLYAGGHRSAADADSAGQRRKAPSSARMCTTSLFTMHGTTMIFFFATPMLFGFGNFLVPLMLGSRDMAFPRLNAFGYWVFLFSGLFMYSSFLVGAAPNGGWFAYVPLTSLQYSPGPNLDFWGLGLIFLSIASTAGATNFIVSILKMRAPGMSINRMPLFIWAILVTSFAVIFAVPAADGRQPVSGAGTQFRLPLLRLAVRRQSAAVAAFVLDFRAS